MNWPAHPASADALAGVHGRIVDSRVARLFASASAASSRFVESTVLMDVGWRNGNALLLMSSASPGTSSAATDVVSARRSRTVLRYSRDVRRRRGRRPAAFGSAGALPAAPPVPVPALPALPVVAAVPVVDAPVPPEAPTPVPAPAAPVTTVPPPPPEPPPVPGPVGADPICPLQPPAAPSPRLNEKRRRAKAVLIGMVPPDRSHPSHVARRKWSTFPDLSRPDPLSRRGAT